MDTLEAIAMRRSIRRFRSDPIPQELLEKVLKAGIMAPSGKNQQSWRFVVVRDDKRAAMVAKMREGIAGHKSRGESVGSAEGTAAVMEQAPVTVFIFNTDGKAPWLDHSIGERFWEIVCVQSIGAAIQNLCLAAHSLGLGSLWICDVFYAYEELSAWLGQDTQMVAAVALGYPAEHPVVYARKPLADVTVWL